MSHPSASDTSQSIAAGKKLLKWVFVMGSFLVFALYLYVIHDAIPLKGNLSYADLEVQDKIILAGIFIITTVLILPPAFLAYPVYKGRKLARKILLFYLYINTIYIIIFYSYLITSDTFKGMLLQDIFNILVYPLYIYFINFNKNTQLYLNALHPKKRDIHHAIDELGTE